MLTCNKEKLEQKKANLYTPIDNAKSTLESSLDSINC